MLHSHRRVSPISRFAANRDPDSRFPAKSGNGGFPDSRFRPNRESGIPSPIPGQIGNRGNGNWGFPGLGRPRQPLLAEARDRPGRPGSDPPLAGRARAQPHWHRDRDRRASSDSGGRACFNLKLAPGLPMLPVTDTASESPRCHYQVWRLHLQLENNGAHSTASITSRRPSKIEWDTPLGP